MTIENKIKELRLNRNLSQAALADLVGTSSQNVGLIERGERELNVRWMEKFAKALFCDPADLLPNPGIAGPNGGTGEPEGSANHNWKDDTETFKRSMQIIMEQLEKVNIVPTHANLVHLIDIFLKQIDSHEQLQSAEAEIIAKTVVSLNFDSLREIAQRAAAPED